MAKTLKIFTQPVCPACPPAKELGKALEKNVKVVYFDTLTPDGLAEAQFHNVMSTPTLVLVEDGKEIKQWIGTPEQSEVEALL